MTNLIQAYLYAQTVDNLDDAIAPIQDIIGVTDGGYASMFFDNIKWDLLTNEERRPILRNYIISEINSEFPHADILQDKSRFEKWVETRKYFKTPPEYIIDQGVNSNEEVFEYTGSWIARRVDSKTGEITYWSIVAQFEKESKDLSDVEKWLWKNHAESETSTL